MAEFQCTGCGVMSTHHGERLKHKDNCPVEEMHSRIFSDSFAEKEPDPLVTKKTSANWYYRYPQLASDTELCDALENPDADRADRAVIIAEQRRRIAAKYI